MSPFEPISQPVLQSGLQIFSQVSIVMMGFVGMVFAMRIAFLMARFSAPAEYGALLIDLISYYGIVGLYPMLIQLMSDSIESIAIKIHVVDVTNPDALLNVANKFFSVGSIGHIAAELITSIVTNVVGGCYSVFIGLLLGMAPLLIFTGTVLGLGHGIRNYMLSLLSLMVWPITWNIIGLLQGVILSHVAKSEWQSAIYGLVFLLLQILSPFFSAKLFSSMESGISQKVAGAVGYV